jgi:hypothetical protein
VALTDVAIRNAKPGAKPVKMTDGGGMFLLVTPAGGKLWRLKYRLDGKEKLLAIGAYPEISLGEARRRREEARELIAIGKDPSREKQRESARPYTGGGQVPDYLRRILREAATGWAKRLGACHRDPQRIPVVPGLWLHRQAADRRD